MDLTLSIEFRINSLTEFGLFIDFTVFHHKCAISYLTSFWTLLVGHKSHSRSPYNQIIQTTEVAKRVLKNYLQIVTKSNHPRYRDEATGML